MLSFKNFLIEAEMTADEPVPQGVNPQDWANPTWRKYWKMQHQTQNTNPMGTGQVYNPNAVGQAPLGGGELENGIRSWSGANGNPQTGQIGSLPTNLQALFSNKLKNNQIKLFNDIEQAKADLAGVGGRAVRFFGSKWLPPTKISWVIK